MLHCSSQLIFNIFYVFCRRVTLFPHSRISFCTYLVIEVVFHFIGVFFICIHYYYLFFVLGSNGFRGSGIPH